MKFPSFVGASYRSQSLIASGEDLINWYVARIDSPGAAFPTALYPAPGVTPFLTVPEPGRGLFSQSDRLWSVNGAKVREHDRGGTSTVKGTVAVDANPATMTTNGKLGGQLFLTSGNFGYILDLDTSVFTQVVTGALMGGMLDDIFMVLDADTSTVKFSNSSGSGGGLTWDPTQEVQRSSASDPWRALIVVNKKIYLLGELTSEVWWNAGNFPIPFAPIGSSIIPYGIAAPFSAKPYLGGLAWLAQNSAGARTVVHATGYSSAEKISDEAVDNALSQCAECSDAEGLVYQDQGLDFYALNIPSANLSFVFDPVGRWHKRGVWNSEANRYDVWHAQAHAYAFDQHLVTDRTTGTISTMSITLGLDAGGVPMRRERISPMLGVENRLLVYPSFELEIDTGPGISSGQGEDPLVFLQTSRNGAKHWGPSRRRRAGKMGAARRVVFTRIGGARSLSFRTVVSDPLPWRVMGAYLGEAA